MKINMLEDLKVILNQIAVFCNRPFKLLPKFVFEMSTFHCYTQTRKHRMDMINA